MSKALIFDCDGVLGDTERDGHLPAFNHMWRELGVSWNWSVEEYGRALKIGGGKERMSSLFADPEFVARCNPPAGEQARKEMIALWHRRKSAIFQELIRSGQIPPRSGVKRISKEALAKGWLLAVASTSAPESVEAVLRRAMGDALAARFLLLAGDMVRRKKPAPEIYCLAMEKLGVAPSECVAVEDSNNGVEAAAAAGIRCVVTVSGYTREEDFSKAALVLTCLGDPGGEVCQVLENRSAAAPGAYLTAADLEAVLTS